jgi:hypothetical protein
MRLKRKTQKLLVVRGNFDSKWICKLTNRSESNDTTEKKHRFGAHLSTTKPSVPTLNFSRVQSENGKPQTLISSLTSAPSSASTPTTATSTNGLSTSASAPSLSSRSPRVSSKDTYNTSSSINSSSHPSNDTKKSNDTNQKNVVLVHPSYSARTPRKENSTTATQQKSVEEKLPSLTIPQQQQDVS